MANLIGSERARYVQCMFSRIAQRYELMNRLMTAGQDVRWRREVICRAALPAGGYLLDLGAGTGNLSREALRQVPGCRVVAADFTLAMMRAGQAHDEARDTTVPLWIGADALELPFHDEKFDAVVSGFLLRNVSDVRQALAEQWQVLKSGGHIIVLDTTRPRRNLLSPFIHFHLHTIIPALGALLVGDSEAYTYLPDSTENFLETEALAALMVKTGFRQVGFHRLMFGTVAIHWGSKE